MTSCQSNLTFGSLPIELKMEIFKMLPNDVLSDVKIKKLFNFINTRKFGKLLSASDIRKYYLNVAIDEITTFAHKMNVKIEIAKNNLSPSPSKHYVQQLRDGKIQPKKWMNLSLLLEHLSIMYTEISNISQLKKDPRQVYSDQAEKLVNDIKLFCRGTARSIIKEIEQSYFLYEQMPSRCKIESDVYD